MEKAVIIIFLLLALFVFLQMRMGYTSPLTDLDTERPVTWNYDWGGGAGYSRFLINGEIS
jgi:hypothetical protein